MRRVYRDTMIELDVDYVKNIINHQFESLLCESETFIMSMSGKKGTVELSVSGEVKIIDTVNDIVYKDDQRFENEVLMSSIKYGDIYNDTDYVVDMNNWFSVVSYDRDNYAKDAEPFEPTPRSLKQLFEFVYMHYEKLEN